MKWVLPAQVQLESRLLALPTDWYGDMPRHSATVTSRYPLLMSIGTTDGTTFSTVPLYVYRDNK